MEVISYKRNRIEIELPEDNQPRMIINAQEIDVDIAEDMPGYYRNALSYLPAKTLEELAEFSINQQLSLTTPTLQGMSNEQ